MFSLLTVLAVVDGVEIDDDQIAFMMSQGLSEQAAKGILLISHKYRGMVEDKEGNEEEGQRVMQLAQDETAEYMKTQSEEDQAAYKAMIDKEGA